MGCRMALGARTDLVGALTTESDDLGRDAAGSGRIVQHPDRPPAHVSRKAPLI